MVPEVVIVQSVNLQIVFFASSKALQYIQSGGLVWECSSIVFMDIYGILKDWEGFWDTKSNIESKMFVRCAWVAIISQSLPHYLIIPKKPNRCWLLIEFLLSLVFTIFNKNSTRLAHYNSQWIMLSYPLIQKNSSSTVRLYNCHNHDYIHKWMICTTVWSFAYSL